MAVFKKVQSAEPVISFVADTLRQHLQAGERVLWLIAGGSCVPLATAVAERLAGEDLHLLSVTLTDERYGDVGHPDSNWKQLEDAGLSLPGALLHPVLGGEDRQATAQAFSAYLAEAFEATDYRFGLFGMGADGHTAGLFPKSSVLTSTEMAADFQGADFARISMTPAAIDKLDMAVLYAMGEAKQKALNNLDNELQLDRQPAQVLKHVPDFIVFSDFKGE